MHSKSNGKSCTSAPFSAEQFEKLEPDNARYADGYTYDNIDRMYHRESEYLSKKRNRQDKAEKDNRAAGYPPDGSIGSLVYLADTTGPGTVGHHEAEVKVIVQEHEIGCLPRHSASCMSPIIK